MDPASLVAERQRVMAIAARARPEELERLLGALAPLPAVDDVRAPETGLVMLRGRMGGDGAPFNLGEASVSRAAVRLATGETGFSYLFGRDRRKARAAAVLDALVQVDSWRARLAPGLSEIAGRLEAEARSAARRTAATRVDFFTLARGED